MIKAGNGAKQKHNLICRQPERCGRQCLQMQHEYKWAASRRGLRTMSKLLRLSRNFRSHHEFETTLRFVANIGATKSKCQKHFRHLDRSSSAFIKSTPYFGFRTLAEHLLNCLLSCDLKVRIGNCFKALNFTKCLFTLFSPDKLEQKWVSVERLHQMKSPTVTMTVLQTDVHPHSAVKFHLQCAWWTARFHHQCNLASTWPA